MKKHLYRLLSCALLCTAAVVNLHATNRFGETHSFGICPGERITLSVREVVVTSDTILVDTLVYAGETENDSVFERYEVNVFPRYEKEEYKRISAEDSLEWQDTVLYDAGNYERTYHSFYGCDSIFRLTLETYPIDTVDTTVTICPSASYTWHEITASMSGDYERKGTRANGDIVVYRLHVTMLTMQEKEFFFQVCDEENVTFAGNTYADAGTYYEQYTCDTLYKIVITKHPTQLQ